MTSNKRSLARVIGRDTLPRIDAALERAGALCAAEGLRMTPGRRKVLGILLQEHRPLGAYDILNILKEAGTRPQPAIVYRALHFLTDHGFAHRIERLNAYIACTHPREGHSPAFMICRMCHAGAEADLSPANGALGAAARDAGFRIERTMVEAEGVCPNCADPISA